MKSSIKLLNELLLDVKSKTAHLIEDRDRLQQLCTSLELRVTALESELESALESKPEAVSEDPVARERIRNLVNEIDACIAMMPQRDQVETIEPVTA
ncbi:MAG: hypothetical protein P8M07_01410 [Flavobacteriales bacterium]|jgi:hypothetical protein|nr:hypothetical protein [Flavobacteriales bacterium]